MTKKFNWISSWTKLFANFWRTLILLDPRPGSVFLLRKWRHQFCYKFSRFWPRRCHKIRPKKLCKIGPWSKSCQELCSKNFLTLIFKIFPLLSVGSGTSSRSTRLRRRDIAVTRIMIYNNPEGPNVMKRFTVVIYECS